MVNDPIADFIIQIQNAGMAGKASVVIPYSNEKNAIAELLLKEGYVESVFKKGKKVKKGLEVTLKYESDGSPRVNGVKRVSKPSRRMYVGTRDLKKAKTRHGLLILSTPLGILTDKDAMEKRVGGEMLFEIW